MSLHEHDGQYVIRVDGAELMSTRAHFSEEKLADLACAHLSRHRNARILVGGLGFGFTLRAVLAKAPPDSRIVVSEIMEEVVAWNRNPAFGLAIDLLRDKRVQVLTKDVADVIRENPAGFNSVILDVDNGAGALSTEGNRQLYRMSGLVEVKKSLREGGCVAYWSAVEDPKFARLMSHAGFEVKTERCQAHVNSGRWHTLLLGRVK